MPERSVVKHDPEPTRLSADPLPHPQPSAGGRCRRVRRSRGMQTLGCTICCTGAVPRCRTAHQADRAALAALCPKPAAEETCPLLPPQDPTVTLSVIVPVYNGEATIGPCLDSILQQETSCTVQLIVVDSDSTDGTAAVLERYRALPGCCCAIAVRPAAPPPPATRDCATPWAAG